MVAYTRQSSRRRFLTSTAFGLFAPSFILSREAHGAKRRPASDRVAAALVGCGGRGMGLLSIHDDPGCTIAAVCDVDWDLWLGPAPWAAYHPARCHFTFRYFMDYGGGAIADNGVHMFSVVSWAMGADRTGPVTVEATGGEAPNNLYDVPVEMRVRYEFADPPFTMLWEQPGGGSLNVDFIGSQATLSGFSDFKVSQGQADVSPTRSDELHLERSESQSGNWLECTAARRRPVMDVEIGHRVTCWSHLGNIAYRLGRRLRWDPAAERFVGDDEADRLLHSACREPWRL